MAPPMCYLRRGDAATGPTLRAQACQQEVVLERNTSMRLGPCRQDARPSPRGQDDLGARLQADAPRRSTVAHLPPSVGEAAV
eukprot:scaffold1009_cov375-Prasinococcus_capsulatus_cf.AAC.6